MSDLERELEAGFAEIRPFLDGPPLRGHALIEVRESVHAEAERLRSVRRAQRLRPLLAAAAGALLALAWPRGVETNSVDDVVTPQLALDDWQVALSASGERVAALFGADEADAPAPDELCDDLLRSLEDSLDALDRAMGA